MKRMLIVAALILAAGCGDEPVLQLEQETVEFSEVVLQSPADPQPSRVLSGSKPRQIVYVNFDGPTIEDCHCSDARINQSLVIGYMFDAQVKDFAPYTHAGNKASIVENLRDWFADYNISFTTTRPADGDFTMLVISPTTGPHHGVAPLNCNNTNPNDIAFVYKIGSSSADTISRFAAHELGHSFGLGHVKDSTDIMQWASAGRAFERSTLDLSAAHKSGDCVDGGPIQDEPVLLTSALGPILPESWNGTFVDDDSSIFEDAIEKIAAEGITQGCGQAPPRYCPDDTVTRGQMAAFLTRALSLPAATDDYFADDDGSVFEDAINRLAQAEITLGCGDSLYCPNDSVTRGQMAVFLTRALALPATATDHFDDDVDRFYESSADRMYEAGITRGCGDRKYCGEEPVTRGQMAAFLARALGL